MARIVKPWPRRFLVAVVCLLFAVPGAGRAQFDTKDLTGQDKVKQQEFGDSRDRVKVSVVPATKAVAPGGDLPIAIIFDHANHWHIHLHEIKEAPEALGDVEFLIPTDIKAKLVEGAGVELNKGLLQWPKATQVNVGSPSKPVMYKTYTGRAIAYLPVSIAPDAATGQTVKIEFTVTYQACGRDDPKADSDVCIAPVFDQAFTVTFDIVSPQTLQSAPDTDVPNSSVFSDFSADVWQKIRSGDTGPENVPFQFFGLAFNVDVSHTIGLLLVLGIAAVGGFLLNLTPCVLPVIPLKIMSLSQTAGNRRRCFLLGLTMSFGVVAFWLGLGGIIAGISGFTATNQLFQYPAFTITVGVVIAVMAVGMCGLFAVRLPTWVYRLNPKHDSYIGSFGFGIMTAVLSTPCTAPFMGAAAAWAATKTPAIILLTFAAIGCGMALPYLILSAAPALVQKMPRTGPASELLKQVMGLLMLAAAAYFVGVGLAGVLQTPPQPVSLVYWWPVMGFIAAAGVWLVWRTIQITTRPPRRAIFGGLGVILVAASVYGGVVLTDEGPIDWVYYTPEKFSEKVSEGNVVVMDFTAEWCLNCKALERSVLHSEQVVKALQQEGVVPMKVDLTGGNKRGNDKLKETGRVTIPWLVIYDAGGQVVFKSDYYTVEQVVEAVRQARGTAIAETPTPVK